ncbi:MAG: hypothetical protein ATN33_03360 [Epulopiscium sp. Nele67-Bin001]|nr:MAG: hypothetical protein ATN33_03360 [Epulopiscium sp. Nele67-Bin001]
MKKFWLLASCLLFVGCGYEEVIEEEPVEVIHMRLADTMTGDYPAAAGAVEFARLVNERSEGRIQIDIYADGVLGGDEIAYVDQLEFGGIDMARVNIANMSEYEPALNLLQMGFLYDDEQHLHRVIDSEIGVEMLAMLEDHGFIGLAIYEAGYRHFYATVPIESIDDLKGMKMRIPYNQLMVDTVTALGAVAVPLAFGDVHNSIRIGLVDAAGNNFSSYVQSAHYDVAPYISLSGHTTLPDLLMCSKVVFDQLSEEDQLLIRQAALDSVPYQRELYSELEAVAIAELVRLGVDIIELEDRDAFAETVKPVYEQYMVGYEDFVERINQLRVVD